MSVSEASFGPSALATPANAVTITRLLLTAPLVMLLADRPEGWAVFLLWFILCSTDGIDGVLARRHGTTRSGAFLDPLADKVLVMGALAALVAAREFWWAPVTLIAVREMGISLFRTYWGRQGLAVPASRMAKLKTVTQEFAVAFAILPLTADVDWVANVTLWGAVLLTLVSGVLYIQAGSRATRLGGSV